MMKLLTHSRCTSCKTLLPQLLSINIRQNTMMIPNLDDSKLNLLRKQRDDYKKQQDTHNNQIYAKQNKKRIEAVKAVLQKHNIDLEESVDFQNMFYELPWTIEKRIMLLKELGTSKIKPYIIAKFVARTKLATKVIKAACNIDVEADLLNNLYSHLKDPNFNRGMVPDINEDLSFKEFFIKSLSCYLKQKINANEDELSCLDCRKGSVLLYNSFSLLEENLKFLMDELNFDKALILSNRSLLGLHPDQGRIALQMLKDYFGDLTFTLIKKHPKILEYDVYDLEVYLSYLKDLNASPSDVVSYHLIFRLCSAEYKRRQNNLLNNPFTVVYKEHPRFFILIQGYYTILPRIRYLQENNFKFATIHSLTTFHNHLHQLSTIKRLTKKNLMFFLQSQYKDDTALLTKKIQMHPFYMFASLVQMHETLDYLKTTYTKDDIYKNAYAILYNKLDLIAARNIIMSNPEYCRWKSRIILALCIYKIEENNNFSGAAVLTPLKYAESCEKKLEPELSTEDGTKNN